MVALSPELFERWAEHCKTEGLRPTTKLRQLLMQELARIGQVPAEPTG